MNIRNVWERCGPPYHELLLGPYRTRWYRWGSACITRRGGLSCIHLLRLHLYWRRKKPQ